VVSVESHYGNYHNRDVLANPPSQGWVGLGRVGSRSSLNRHESQYLWPKPWPNPTWPDLTWPGLTRVKWVESVVTEDKAEEEEFNCKVTLQKQRSVDQVSKHNLTYISTSSLLQTYPTAF